MQQSGETGDPQPDAEATREPLGEGVQLVRQIDTMGAPPEPDASQLRPVPARQAPVAQPASAPPAGAATKRPPTGQNVWQARMRRALAMEKQP